MTNKERYFLELLQPILNYYNLPANTFKIGHLKMYIETTLDRRAIGLQRFNLTGNGIGVHELKALMANLKTISHELAHLMYDTEDNTKYHFEMEDKIYL